MTAPVDLVANAEPPAIDRLLRLARAIMLDVEAPDELRLEAALAVLEDLEGRA